MPTLSIVTIHYKDFAGLARTYESILSAHVIGNDVEWIVIDGGSDFSNVPELYQSVSQSATVFISEPDGGIYEAMNKGVGFCSGRYVLFLNAGDTWHEDNEINKLLDLLVTLNPVLLYGHAAEGIDGQFDVKLARRPQAIWWGMPTHHQAMIFDVDIVQKNLFDVKYRIAADYKMVAQIYKNYLDRVFLIDTVLCTFYLDGLSSENYYKGLAEQFSIRYDILGYSRVSSSIIWLVKALAREFRSYLPSFYSVLRYKKNGN